MFFIILFNLVLSTSSAQSFGGFLDSQVKAMVEKIESRQFDDKLLRTPQNLKLPATRNALTDWLYDNQLVEYSDLTLFYSDKLLMGKLLYHYLGGQAPYFTPYVMGLKEFLEKEDLLNQDGVINASEEKIKYAFKKHFPEGFVMKPPVSWATDGKGFYTKENEVVALLVANDPKLYQAHRDKLPFLPPSSAVVTSGERWMIMGKIKNTNLLDENKKKVNREFRVHTFHDYVVTGATHHRYGLDDNDQHYAMLNSFSDRLLKSLPKKLTQQQAWSLDIFLQADGQPILIEVNSNRGERTNWSDFLRSPEVLAGYTNFFDLQFGWHLTGVEGQLMRAGIGNLRSHLKHELPYYKELIAETKDEVELAYILEDLKDTSQNYQDRLKRVKLTNSEESNTAYLTTVRVINAFSDKLQKTKKIGDEAWDELVQWIDWFVQWDGR